MSRQARHGTALTTGILLVDDSFLMRRVIRGIVEQYADMRVIAEAADGIEALHHLGQVEPDVILLDIEMPRMDGIEFLRHARLQTLAPVIVISSLAQLGSAPCIAALELGAADVLPKPSGVLSLDYESLRGSALADAIRRQRPEGKLRA